MPHVIRLRGPWRYEALAHTQQLADGSIESQPIAPIVGRCQPPCDWEQDLGRAFRGRVRYERSFNKPTGLSAGDRVDLVIQKVDAFATVWLNGQRLGEFGGDEAFRRNVVDLLALQNLLAIEIDLPAQAREVPPLPRGDRPADAAGGLTGEVQLELFDGEPASRPVALTGNT
ncbi:glycosyl hydrolase 2 galactose-binding domain-containing protein [Lignipirellula cremea]|uniref:Glycosyl hydrolases family 2, sugar binding domain n=1 Tax=Lignipirellula cremea TaxID=2528010 RepID=A0A518DMX4_9BACT|nr:hypothetical protein [Lignipirellula cremea]QDU93171.1 Glycosyl hydrolases family 2, sugar binding domain [Lignipirellula cremea]